MGTQKLLQNISGFSGGLNTEKSVLNILPSEMANGSINVDIDADGSVRPRTGVDFLAESDNTGFLQTLRTESTGTDDTQESPSGVFARFTASDATLVDRVVVYANNVFKVFLLTEASLATFDTPSQTITPTSRVGSEQREKNTHWTFGDNKLFFCGDKLQFGYISLAANNTDLEITYLEIRTRNLLDTDYAQVGSRVKNTTSGNVYAYEAIVAHTSGSGSPTDEPGDGATWQNNWVRLDIEPTGESAWATSTAYVANIQRTNTYTETMSNSLIRPDAIGFWKARLWIILGDRIYYSQVGIRADKYQNFYQAADPFDTADPLPVEGDGGSFLSEGGKGLQLLPLGNSMFFTTPSALYEVRSSGVGFDHTNFSVTQVLNEEIQSTNAMVIAEDTLYLFGNGNIWRTIGRDNLLTDDRTVFESVGDNKIQTLYSGIPRANKGSAYPIYNPSTRKIYWFHSQATTDFDTAYRDIEGYSGYARHCLVLDVKVTRGLTPQDDQANRIAKNTFSLWEYNDGANSELAYIAGSFLAPPIEGANSVVLAAADTVIDGSSDTVIAGTSSDTESSNRKLYCLVWQRSETGGNAITKGAIGQALSGALFDFPLDGTNTQEYTAKIFTGVQTYGDVLHNKATTYILFLFERLINGVGSCLIRTAYNWSPGTLAGEATNKTSAQKEVYKETKIAGGVSISTANHTHTWYKHRVRGRGKSFQIVLESTPGLDFRLIGWSQQFYGDID